MKQQLSKTIMTRGVQFMISSETEIHVGLTETGMHKYHRLVHLRPGAYRKHLYFSMHNESSQILFLSIWERRRKSFSGRTKENVRKYIPADR